MRDVKLRRLRKTSILRDWIGQTELSYGDMILPYFVTDGVNIKEPIESMPGVYRLSVDNLIKAADNALLQAKADGRNCSRLWWIVKCNIFGRSRSLSISQIHADY